MDDCRFRPRTYCHSMGELACRSFQQIHKNCFRYLDHDCLTHHICGWNRPFSKLSKHCKHTVQHLLVWLGRHLNLGSSSSRLRASSDSLSWHLKLLLLLRVAFCWVRVFKVLFPCYSLGVAKIQFSNGQQLCHDWLTGYSLSNAIVYSTAVLIVVLNTIIVTVLGCKSYPSLLCNILLLYSPNCVPEIPYKDLGESLKHR